MTVKNLKVGQIIYVIFKKQSQLIPFRVLEEISRKTMQGNTVSYKLECGAQPGQVIDISQIEGEIFLQPSEARGVMIERATNAVDRMVKVAIAKSNEWYGVPTDVPNSERVNQQMAEVGQALEHAEFETDEPTMVQLPDGKIARLKVKNS